MKSVHWQRNVHPSIREHDTLERVDYADTFIGLAEEPATISPRAWSRALGPDAPRRVRFIVRAAHLVQRRVLGLHVDGRSTDRVLGWRLAAAGDHWFRMEAEGWLGEGHLVFHADGTRVSIGTLLRYDHRMAAMVWVPVSLLHRQVGLALLRHLLSDSALTAASQPA